MISRTSERRLDLGIPGEEEIEKSSPNLRAISFAFDPPEDLPPEDIPPSSFKPPKGGLGPAFPGGGGFPGGTIGGPVKPPQEPPPEQQAPEVMSPEPEMSPSPEMMDVDVGFDLLDLEEMFRLLDA